MIGSMRCTPPTRSYVPTKTKPRLNLFVAVIVRGRARERQIELRGSKSLLFVLSKTDHRPFMIFDSDSSPPMSVQGFPSPNIKPQPAGKGDVKRGSQWK